MVKIFLQGKPKYISTTEVRQSSKFFSDYLLKRLSKTVTITIVFINNLFLEERDYGRILVEDSSTRRPRIFTIEIDSKLDKKRTILTLAHEIVHAEQYSRGRLKDSKNFCYRKWLGVVFEDDYAYNKQPWETEAFELEPFLYQLWIDHRRNFNEQNFKSTRTFYARSQKK